MHQYATNSSERKKVVFAIAVLSVACAYALHQVIERTGLRLPWWVDAPSVLGFFGVLYQLFDKWLWRVAVFRKIGIVKVPDLNGRWGVEGHTSFDRNHSYSGESVIQQTWTAISVFMETDNSRSHSLSASLLVEQPEGCILSYEYRNEPKPSALSTMHAHRGTCVLRLKDSGLLQGEYYSGRDRQNYGGLILRRRTGESHAR
jgi:hypothetical protein